MNKWSIGLVTFAAFVATIVYLALYGGRGTAFGGLGLLGGAVALLPERDRVRSALRAAAERYGRPPDWYEALGWVESRWTLDAIGDNGQSIGSTQIQRRTLVVNGYSGDPLDLTRDPDLAADWTVRLTLPGAKNAEGVALLAPLDTPSDLAAWWNAGRQNLAALPADHETRTDYAPKLVAAVESLQTTGVA